MQDSQFTRKTEQFSDRKVRQEVELLYQLAMELVGHEPAKAIATADSYRRSLAENQTNSLLEDISLLKAHLCATTGQLDYAQDICANLLSDLPRMEDKEVRDYLAIRVYTLQLKLLLAGCKRVNQEETVSGLMELLRQERRRVYEVIEKLTGCSQMRLLLQKNIVFGEEDISRRARKYDALAAWKLIGGRRSEALNYKELALDSWTKSNRMSEFRQCERELSEMRDGKGLYFVRLSTLSRLVLPMLALLGKRDPITTQKNVFITLGLHQKLNKIHQGQSSPVSKYSFILKAFMNRYRRELGNEVSAKMGESSFMRELVMTGMNFELILIRSSNRAKERWAAMFQLIRTCRRKNQTRSEYSQKRSEKAVFKSDHSKR